MTILRSICISRHVWLRTGGLCWSRVLLPQFPCWWHVAHLDYGENSYVEFSPPSLPILSHHHIMEQLNGC